MYIYIYIYIYMYICIYIYISFSPKRGKIVTFSKKHALGTKFMALKAHTWRPHPGSLKMGDSAQSPKRGSSKAIIASALGFVWASV